MTDMKSIDDPIGATDEADSPMEDGTQKSALAVCRWKRRVYSQGGRICEAGQQWYCNAQGGWSPVGARC